ncbi:hypothetical protein COY23_02515 [bacterium (Candidatus Torokbacteria) CG_4_10_14_0_2_um_filter_35_8]|nr:MAG: hypothetical protein COY23_02515 [bacterium (Candidatus Torokbacteria) CG_4_10_14_0_2_um_filter_35_8]
MDKRNLLRMLLSLFAVSLIIIPLATSGVELKEGETSIEIEEDEKISDDVVAASGVVNLKGEVEGDLMAAGGQVRVSGKVSQNASITGGMIEISGEIGDDLRVVGGQIEISGKVNDDVFVGGGNVMIKKDARIKGDLFCGSGTLDIDGDIEGDVHIGAGEVSINGTIEGDVKLQTDKLKLGEDALIRGDLDYSSREDTTSEIEDKVEGKITYSKPEDRRGAGIFRVLTVNKVARRIISILGMILVAIISIALFPKKIEEVGRIIERRTIPNFLYGILVIIAAPVLIVFLFITIIGIPLAIFTIFFYLVLLYLAKVLISIFIGKKVCDVVKIGSPSSLIFSAIIGVLLFNIIGLIPILGWILTAVGSIIALGALGVMIFAWFNNVRKPKEETTEREA